jgi:hypothetical protein
MTKAIGEADNTAAAQQWLNSCRAVIYWSEQDDLTIHFTYNPAIEVPQVPHFVRF